MGRIRGQDRERAELREHAEAAAGGAGRVVTLIGPAGSGKTTLFGEAADSAAEVGLRVLRARASEAEQAVPYGVIRQLLAPAASEARRSSARAALARALVLGDGSAEPDDVAALGVSVHWLVVELADHPLALCVDDLHWVDDTSLRALDILRVRFGELPLLILTTCRAAAPGAWGAVRATPDVQATIRARSVGPLRHTPTADQRGSGLPVWPASRRPASPVISNT